MFDKALILVFTCAHLCRSVENADLPLSHCSFLREDTQLLPNQVLSEQQSLVVMKKLLAIAVSGITYLRGLFPEKAYGSKYKVMILREERSCPGASQIFYIHCFYWTAS
uniref:HORMA domain containing 1 n=1 Tax=Labrus bergylta TaxID=56723 RepID=A0A3Q3GR47_9LABR